MKKLLLMVVIAGLMACNTTEECCTTIQPQDANDLPFDIDSITNVRQLLDSLNEVPQTHF